MDATLKKELRGALGEFIATTLFIYAGCCSVVNLLANGTAVDPVSVSLAFGFAIAVLVACFANISGGHINPAVTWALMISGNVSIRRGVLYIVAQLAGGVAGAGFLRASAGDSFSDGVGVNAVAAELTAGQGMLLEAFFTLILVTTVFHVAVARPGTSGGAVFAPLTIGLAVAIGHLCTVRLTGTGINPARSFGPALVQDKWDDHWIYWVGPLLGATVAVPLVWIFYGTVHADKIHLKSGADALDLDGVEQEQKDVELETRSSR